MSDSAKNGGHTSWLNIGRSFNASLSVVPSISSDSRAINNLALGEAAETSFCSSDDSSNHKKKRKRHSRDEIKRSRKHDRSDKKDSKKDKHRHKEKNHDEDEYKKKSRKVKHHHSHRHEDSKYEQEFAPVTPYTEELMEEYRKYKEEFDSSSEEEEEIVSSHHKFTKIKDKDRGLLIQDVPTSSSLVITRGPHQKDGDYDISWNYDRRPDLDIPLFVGYRYYPTQPQQIPQEINSGVVHNTSKSMENNQDRISGLDAIFHQKNTVLSLQEYRARKRNEADNNFLPRDNRYFGRNHRYLLTDPNVLHLQFRSNQDKLQIDAKTHATEFQRFLHSSFLPVPILDKDIADQLQNNELHVDQVLCKEDDKEMNNIEVVKQSNQANQQALEISKYFNIALREHPENVELCLAFVNAQLELFRLQKEANGKYSSVLEKVRLSDKLLLSRDKAILERQISILQTTISSIEEHINIDDFGTYKDLLTLYPLYTKLWNCQKLCEIPDKVLQLMKETIKTQPLISSLSHQINSFQHSIYGNSNYEAMKRDQENFYSDYQERMKNLLAIQQLSSDVLAMGSLGNDKRALRVINADLTHVYLDRFLSWLRYESVFGHSEMVIALTQAMLYLNSPKRLLEDWQSNFGNMSKIEEFWDAESGPRYGESYNDLSELETLPSDEIETILRSNVLYCCGDIRKLIANEYSEVFRQPIVEGPQKAENIGLSIQPERSSSEQVEEAPKPQLVYSRIHGHKIWIVPEDSRKTYKKILQEIGSTDGRNDQMDDAHNLSSDTFVNHDSSNANFNLFDENDPYINSYFRDFVSSIVQNRPLRSLLERNLSALESQPERAVLFADMRSLLFHINSGQSEVNENFLNLHFQLLVISLEAMGIHLMNANVSHGFLGKTYFDTVAHVDHYDCESFLEDVNLFWNQYAFHNFQSCLDWISASFGSTLQNRVFVDKRVLDQYSAMYDTGYLTSINFVITLIETIYEEYEKISELSLSWKNSTLLRNYSSQLRSLLIELIAVEGKAAFGCSNIILKDKALLRKNLKAKCLRILESSIPRNGIMGSLESMNTKMQNRTDSCVGDLKCWRAFLASNIIMSANNKEALKLAHTVLQQLSDSSLTAPLSLVDGIAPFYWQVVALLLELPTMKSTNPSFKSSFNLQNRTALRIIVQLGCSNALAGGADNSHNEVAIDFQDYGYYDNCLVNDRILDIDENACAHALKRLHWSISVELDLFNNRIQLYREKLKNMKESKILRIYDTSPCCSLDQLPDIYYSSLLLAWGTFLSMLHFNKLDWINAIQAGDAIFQSIIEIVRSVLLSNFIPGTLKDINVASVCGLGKWGTLSSDELTLLIFLENMYQGRLQYLTNVYALSGLAQSHSHMKSVAATAVKDFPLSSPLLQFWTMMNMISVSGYVSLRHYWTDIEQNRMFWGGGATSKECWFELQAEFIHAIKLSKQVFYDPCGTQILRNTAEAVVCTHDSIVPDWKLLLTKINFVQWPEDRFTRFEAILEGMVSNPNLQHAPWIWRLYWIVLFAHHQYATSFTNIKKRGRHLQEAKKVAIRGMQACGYCKLLYMDLLGPLRGAFSEKELFSITQLMESQGIYIRC